jgi:hypothetical protein
MSRKTFITVCLVVFMTSLCIPRTTTIKTTSVKRISIGSAALKKLTFSYSFVQTYSDPVIAHLNLPGSFGKYGSDNTCGKIIRVLRFQNITTVVEERYNLPKNLLLAMMMEESTGMDLLPNAKDDGGIGLIHQQPAIAQEFGLETYDACNKMVCKKHGVLLRDLIDENHGDRKKLIAYDDRFHPVKNIDAAGRMIACYLQFKLIDGMGPLRSALARYSGAHNADVYWKKILTNMAYLDNLSDIVKVEKYFNTLNTQLVINGSKADFKEYIALSQQQNSNYGLDQYKVLPKYEIKNTDGGEVVYAKFIKPLEKKLPKLECE